MEACWLDVSVLVGRVVSVAAAVVCAGGLLAVAAVDDVVAADAVPLSNRLLTYIPDDCRSSSVGRCFSAW